MKVSQMPDLAVEILSPRQVVDYLVRKINAYFELGVKSCWLVMPSLDEVRFYLAPTLLRGSVYFSGDNIDA
ncbi:MAG: Uma2 family endonuclease [Gammaproteobacteria bacterium]|nr:Uma2 family endonuclease [Gammaproteobacteria bacterium]